MESSEEIPFLQSEYLIFGERVKTARFLSHMASVNLHERTGISKSKISRIENSFDPYMVSTQELDKLSLALNVAPSWFQQPPRVLAASESLHFRRNADFTVTDEQVVSSWIKLMGELIDTLNAKVKFLPISLPMGLASTISPQEAAQETRKALQLSPRTPIDHVIRSAEKLGVFVQTHDFNEELHLKNHDASSAWCSLSSGITVPVMLCRTHSSWERTRFSAAHELGHLVMHRFGTGEEGEEAANQFAGEFLLPSIMLKEEIEEPITLASLRPLKEKWGMSLQALVMHCFRNGLINKAKKTSLIKQLSARRNRETGESWRIREPGADARQVERPMLLGSAISKAYGKPPRIEEFLSSLPTENNNWFRSLLINFDLQWSRDLNAEVRLEAAERALRTGNDDNVISLAQFKNKN